MRLWPALLLLAACPAPDPGPLPQHLHPSTAASGTVGSGGTSASGTTGSSSTGTGGAAGTSGTSGTTGCPAYGSVLPLDDCDAGVELLGNVLNYCNQTNMQNYMGPLTVVDAFDPSLVAATNDCGYFHFCVAPGTEITAQIEGPDFADTLFATIAPMVSEQIPSTPGLVMVCEQEIPILTVGIPGFDATQATVFASIVNPNGIPAMDGGCEDPSGWSFSLVTWDGGLPIAAQHVYYSGGTAPSPNTFVTDATGAGILFDIDATQTPARLLATRLDGGGECANAGAGLPFQLEGQVPLVAGYFTVAPYVEQ